MKQESSTSRFRIYLQLLCAATLVLTLWGCGGSGGYDSPVVTSSAPVTGAATNVLIEPSTLQSWMDQGLVNDSGDFNQKVVVFDYSSYSMDPAVDPERIAGACRVTNADLASKRVEGVATAFPLVATGEQMDAVLQRLGIDKDTVIVFTTGGAMYFPTRAYWMFRYWGFPQENLKLLNGGNAAFAAAYPGLMTRDVPVPTASTFSVKDLDGELNADLRLSIGEMLDFVSSFDVSTDVLLDARGPNNYSGLASSPGYVTGKYDFTVYDGHPAGGQYLLWKDLFVDPTNGDYSFKSAADIEALFAAKGWSQDKTTTVYCLSGYSATPLYFAMEAILGGKVRLYDGSWSQFGQYSDNAAAMGEIPTGSVWSSDQYLALNEGYRYNIDHLVMKSLKVETLTVDSAAQDAPFTGDNPADASDVVPSQMEVDDAAATASASSIITAPVMTDTPSVLIDAMTLDGWMTAGLVNAPVGGERVIVLDASTFDQYIDTVGHIPGAQLLNISTENGMTRLDGVVQTKNMLLTAEKMDELLRSHGIDENTTVVITSSGAAYYPSRVYTNLRYWGFPKNRLKMLDGFNSAYETYAGPGSLTLDPPPAAAASSLTVQDLAGAQVQLRATLSEVMDAARDFRGLAIDFRGDKTAPGSTPGLNSDPGTKVVFEGRPNNGDFYGFSNAFNPDGTFKADIAADMLAASGIDTSTFTAAAPAISYCTSGYVASAGFFILDGILGVPAMIYDGSWSQWGQMSDNSAKGGNLGSYAAWAVDSATYMSLINYNVDTTQLNSIESLGPDAALLDLSTSDPATNQVEGADSDYKAQQPDQGTEPTAPTPGDDPVIGC